MERFDMQKCASIVMAFDRLCASRDYGSIGIQDICDAAGLSRSTFYRVFSSKFEIGAWYQDLLLDASIGQVGKTLDWSGGFCAFHSGWLLFPSMNLAAKEQGGAESVESRWPRKVADLLLRNLSERCVEVDRSLTFQVHFLAAVTRPQGKTASIPWTDDLYGLSPEEYGQIMSTCVPHDLYRLLNDPDDPKSGRRLTLSELFVMS